MLSVRLAALRHDDAYITFQFARNLASGEGFAFNQGEPVFGATTPLFTLLLAACYALFGDVLPAAAVAFGAAGVGAQAWLLRRLLAPAFPATAWIAAAATLVGGLGQLGFLALETHVFVALVLATLWALAEERPLACGLFLGLAFLCRYDAAVLVPLVALGARTHGARLRSLGLAGLVVLPWLVYAWLCFGALLPHTLGAKHGVTAASAYLVRYADLLLRVPGVPGGEHALARLPAVAALAGGLLLAARRAPWLLPLAAFAAIHVAAYAAIGPSANQHWHMAPALLACRLFMLLGCFGALELCARRAGSGSLERRVWRTAGLLLACLWWGALADSFWHLPARIERHASLGARHARYARVAEWIGAHVAPGHSFMAHEVGTLGYLTRLRMIDPYGLINETNDWPRTKEARDFIALLRHYQPDVVLVDTPHQGFLLEQHEGYQVVKVFDWEERASTLAVRSAAVLRDPAQLERLREEPRVRVALASGDRPQAPR